MSAIHKIDRYLGSAKKICATVLSLAVATLMVVEVITRYVLGKPLFGLEEITLVCVMWLYMIGASLACRERSHLKAELIQLVVKSKRALLVLKALATLISLLMAVFIFRWSLDLVIWGLEKQQSTPVFGIPWVVSQSSLLVGSTFFAIYFLRDLVADIREVINGPGTSERGSAP